MKCWGKFSDAEYADQLEIDGREVSGIYELPFADKRPGHQ